jgi:hypothetical protein
MLATTVQSLLQRFHARHHRSILVATRRCSPPPFMVSLSKNPFMVSLSKNSFVVSLSKNPFVVSLSKNPFVVSLSKNPFVVSLSNHARTLTALLKAIDQQRHGERGQAAAHFAADTRKRAADVDGAGRR